MKSAFIQIKPKRFSKILFISIFVSIFTLSSCDYGRHGDPGNSYLAIDWADDEPSFMDVGTSAVPTIFEYGRYYYAYPGYYDLYYQGSFWNGFTYATYAWEVTYRIWRNEGEPGYPNYIDGADGPDSFLTLVLSPFGPWEERMNKSTTIDESFEILIEDEDEIKIRKSSEEFSIDISYRKVEAKY